MNAAGRSHWPNRCGLAITDAPRPDAADRDLESGRQRDKVKQPSLFQRQEVQTRWCWRGSTSLPAAAAPRNRGTIVLGCRVGSAGSRVITIALRERGAPIKARR